MGIRHTAIFPLFVLSDQRALTHGSKGHGGQGVKGTLLLHKVIKYRKCVYRIVQKINQ